MTSLVLLSVVLWLAYSNGANDNFKGVATLYGSATTGFRGSLVLATTATFGGSLLSLVFVSALVKQFAGDGLVPTDLEGRSSLLISVGAATAATILLATVFGMPTSTTHALTGALMGVSMLAGGTGRPLDKLWSGFLLPLLVSPLLAVHMAGAIYPLLRGIRHWLGVSHTTCVCVVPVSATPVAASGSAAASQSPGVLKVTIASAPHCASRYAGRVVGVQAQVAANAVHYLSAAAVCLARAVNDTPKVAALLLAGGLVGGARWKLGLVAATMAIGGLLNSRRVAETMSKRITDLNPGQGLTANLITAALVLGASFLGLPVSTTHVSCGSLFGIGIVTGAARWRTVGAILATWVTTLPCGAVLGAGVFWIVTQMGVA